MVGINVRVRRQWQWCFGRACQQERLCHVSTIHFVNRIEHSLETRLKVIWDVAESLAKHDHIVVFCQPTEQRSDDQEDPEKDTLSPFPDLSSMKTTPVPRSGLHVLHSTGKVGKKWSARRGR